MTQTPTSAEDTRTLIVDAARSQLIAHGYAGLSTRKVAEHAGVPLSQLHYHFGSMGGLILALFSEDNQRRLARQRTCTARTARCGSATSGRVTSSKTISTPAMSGRCRR